MEDYVKRLVTKNGKQRVTIYYDEYAENPRYTTDEPLHCNDWLRDYSIMCDSERDSHYSNARRLIEYLLENYGKRDTIIDMLVENGKHMTDGKSVCNNALVYDRSEKHWVLKEYVKWYSEKEFNWKDATFFDCSKKYIDLGQLLVDCLNSTIDELCYFKYWTDGVKTASYSFGYNGEVSFSDEIGCDSDGICWLEKDEFLKYTGCKEEYWKSKTLREIEFLCDEIEAWSNNEVCGFTVEKRHRFKLHKEYIDSDKDDEDTEEEEWEETDSCWGFYGELSKSEEWILDYVGFKKEDLIEE